jgi:hypothetical protein
MQPAPIVSLETSESVATEIATALQQWNERHVGPRNTNRFALTVRTNDGQLVAGLVGEMAWTFLYGRSLGERSLSTAGIRHRTVGTGRDDRTEPPLHVAFLSTMTFQAPKFYEKCGYTAFGELPHAPEPFGRIWLAKRLAP